MKARIDWVTARMNRRRWAIVASIVVVPTIAMVWLWLSGAFGAAPGVAIIVTVALPVCILIGFAGALWLNRRVRKIRAAAAGPAGDVPPHVVAAFGMATRSPFAREQLAAVATGWRFDLDALMACVRSDATHEDKARELGTTDALALLLLSRVLSSQVLTPSDAADAEALVSFVAQHDRVKRLPPDDRQLLIERLLMAGDVERAATLLRTVNGRSIVAKLLALDVANPFIGIDAPRDATRWLGELNDLFQRAGLDGVHLDSGTHVPLDRLRGATAASSVEGPLVTVVMTCFRPERGALRSAVTSIVDQSWSNWELLLLDDASPAEFTATLTGAADLDPRIVLVRARSNQGTYVRRNEGLTRARGEFVTFHDSDDWAHPRRLELQARHLEAHPDVLANISRSVRVTPQVQFAQPRGTILRITETSLLMRREEAMERVGYFDAVRKAADTGYRRRIEALTARPVPDIDVNAPLTLVRFAAGSLSGNDLRDGWTHPARVAYTNAMSQWVATGGRKLEHPHGERPFPAPPEITGTRPDMPHLDVVYVLDMRDDRHRHEETGRFDREVEAAVAAGLSVGVYRATPLTDGWVSHTTRSQLQALINANSVAEVLPGTGAHARCVVVLDEAGLMGIAGDAVVLDASRAALVPRELRDGVNGVRWNSSASDKGAARLLGDRRVERIRAEQLPSVRTQLARP